MTSTPAEAVPRDERLDVARPPGPSAEVALEQMTRPGAAPWFMVDLAREYPVLTHLMLQGEHAYVLTHPDAIVRVFVDHGRQTMKGHDLKGVAVDASGPDREGEAHVRHRRLAQPAFHRDRIDAYALDMTMLASEHESTWHEGDVVDMQESMAALSLAIMGRTLFDVDLRGDSAGAKVVLDRLLAGMGERMLIAPTPGIQGEARAKGDMLSLLLASQEPGFGFGDAHARDAAIMGLLADPEPTAMALTWTWLLLSQHPEQAEWLHSELDRVLAGSTPRIDDIDRLPRTRAVLSEAMRLYPPSWLEGRRLLADIDIDGWTLPAGCLALASQFALHRSPLWWDAADEFRPQRWIDATGEFDEEAPGQPRGAWFPFGWGSRRCIGERFAWTEATLVLATLAQRWAPQLVPGADLNPMPTLTLRTASGVPMALHRRQHSLPSP